MKEGSLHYLSPRLASLAGAGAALGASPGAGPGAKAGAIGLLAVSTELRLEGSAAVMSAATCETDNVKFSGVIKLT